MTTPESDRLLTRAATKAEGDNFFVASALAAYRSLTEMDDGALASFLGCAGPALSRLALCRLPEEGSLFRDQVQRIADYAGCDPARLAALLRAAAAAERMRAATPGSLLAARDRIAEEPAEDTARPAAPPVRTDEEGSSP